MEEKPVRWGDKTNAEGAFVSLIDVWMPLIRDEMHRLFLNIAV